MAPEVVIGTVIAVAFLVIVILLYKPVTAPKFQLGVKEQVCSYSLTASQTPLGEIGFKPICPTHLISFSEKNIMKDAKKGETVKDAAMHQILDYMLRCKTMISGPKRTGFISEKNCYVCYNLHTDATTPYITELDLASYSFNHKTSTGKSYFYELNADNHWPTVFLNGGIGTEKKSDSKQLSLGQDYGITYVSANKGSFWSTVGTVGAGAGGCVLGAATWFIPYVGPLVGTIVAPTVCQYSLGAASGVALFNIFKPSPAEGTLLFTNYKYLQEKGCAEIVS